MKPRFHQASLVAGILALSAFAHDAGAASITFQQDASDFTTLPSLSSVTNAAPVSITGTVYAPNTNNVGALGTLTGSVANQWRSPFENATSINGGTSTGVGNGGYGLPGWNSLPYSSVQAGGSATYNVGLANTLNILWGSPDSYNTLAFYSGVPSNSTFLGSLSATAGLGIVSGVFPLEIQTYGHDQMTFTDNGGSFEYVVLSSSTNAFEFADLTAGYTQTQLPTPLPAALPLFASGLGAMGLLGWRKRRKNGAAAAAV
jgi:hypothetical protein